MSKVNLYPYFFDPRQGATSSVLMLQAKFHLLLFNELSIQDNFLISQLLADAREGDVKRSPFCDWIERGWVKVALRKGAYSLTHLKSQLYQKALKREYTPFEDFEDGLRLYRSKRFSSYLGELDSCLSTEGAVISWSAIQLGVRFRALMKASAEDGSSGLPPETGLAVWNAIERTASGSGHSRSMYHEYARTLADRCQAKLVRSWAELEYLKNLPDALGMGVSLPRGTLAAVGAWDPMVELEATGAATEPSIVRGRDCVLLNASFLKSLDLHDIEKLRGLDEFRVFTAARLNGSPDGLARALLTYLHALGEEGPKVSDPRIAALEAQVRFKRILGGTAELAGLIIALTNPLVGAALSGCGFLLTRISGTEELLQEAERDTIIRLQVGRCQSPSRALGDFHHGPYQLS